MKTISYCPCPVFIIGAPRSGTSVLGWSLAHHPDFWTSNETDFIAAIIGGEDVQRAYEAGAESGRRWFNEHDLTLREFMSYIGLGINALITSQSGGRRWVEQTPAYTLLADTLADAFPEAFFIHLIRDGRAVVRSMMHFREGIWNAAGNQGEPPEWARSFEAAVGTWCDFVQAARDFGMVHPDRTFTIRNEDLASQPEEHFRELLTFLGAADHPAPANFLKSSRLNSSFGPDVWGSEKPNAWRVRDKRSVKGWGFAEDQGELFTARAAALNELLGYSADVAPDPGVRAK